MHCSNFSWRSEVKIKNIHSPNILNCAQPIYQAEVKKSVLAEQALQQKTRVLMRLRETVAVVRAALTIGLGGAEAPGPEQGGGPWLAVE